MEHMFIKEDTTRNMDPITWNLKTLVAIVERTIPHKNTLFQKKFKCTLIIGLKVRPIDITKNFKKF
jgi:hypothetical protein